MGEMIAGIILFAAMTVLCFVGIFTAFFDWQQEPPSITASVVIPFQGHAEEAEPLLREWRRLTEQPAFCELQLLIVDYGMDAQTRRVCELFCFDEPCARLCDTDEILAAVLPQKMIEGETKTAGETSTGL